MTQLRVREHRVQASSAKSVAIKCGVCGKVGVVSFVTYGTVQERQALISAFVRDHRAIGCPTATAEDGMKYELIYPLA